jgi:hypothetical protein
MDFNWLGWNAIGWGDDVIRKLYNFQFDLHRKNGKKVSHLIWLTTAWCIWLEENDILFDEKVVNILRRMTFWCGYWVHLFKGLVHYFLWKP